MALFEIQRYFGEDDNSESQNQAESILSKLRAEAEARKKQKNSPSREKWTKEDNSTCNNEKGKVSTDQNHTQLQKPSKLKQDLSTPNFNVKSKRKSSSGDSANDIEGLELLKIKAKRNKKQKTQNQDDKDDAGPLFPSAKCVTRRVSTSPKKNINNEKLKQHTDSNSESEISLNISQEDTAESDAEKERDYTDSKEEDYQHGRHEVGGFTVLRDFKNKSVEKVHRVLPDWLLNPNIIASDLKQKTTPVANLPGLDPDIVKKLSENGIQFFFPVQMQVIPEILNIVQHGCILGKGGYRPSDICVSAPTGSGKTLAFALPLIQALKSRVVCKVRALVVVPVRDLASQVYKVFMQYTKDTKLKVGLTVGQKQFRVEQHALVKETLDGYESKVDIIISTPGRLVDHINKTPGFDLSQLRFLVIDEADRMMEQIKQDWLTHVENAVFVSSYRTKPGTLNVFNTNQFKIPLQKLLFSATLSQNPEKLQQLNLFQPKLFTSVDNSEPVLKPVDVRLSEKPEESTDFPVHMEVDSDDRQLKKEILSSDEGNQDKHIKKGPVKTADVSGQFVGKYTTPSGLTEYTVDVNPSEKPLVILHFLHNLQYRHVLCFTNSVESTHRLYHLIRLYGDVNVAEISSKLHPSKRNKVLQKFDKGDIDISNFRKENIVQNKRIFSKRAPTADFSMLQPCIQFLKDLLICSDAMARGMDMENVQFVISYDPPPFIKTYIHRVGRTARAGKTGTAITLVQKKEFHHFKKMTREAGKTNVTPLKIRKEEMTNLSDNYEQALQQLPRILKNEKIPKR